MRTLVNIVCILVFLLGSAFNQPDAKTYYDNGMASLNKKEYIQAIGEFTNAISIQPKYADAYYYRAYAKELLGKKMGFFSPELCSDLIAALQYGKQEAASKLEKSCMGECFNMESAFFEPEIVYCVDFSSKILSDLPAGSEKLHNVVKMNMFNNKLTTLSSKWTGLSNLISLDLSSNKITTIPAVIGSMPQIRELNLYKNQISSLPNEFGELKYIKSLNLRQNAITSLPPAVAKLTSLENLDLALNKLTTLPYEVANMKNLKVLTLVGNEIPLKEQQKIKALLPNTTIYFE